MRNMQISHAANFGKTDAWLNDLARYVIIIQASLYWIENKTV